MSLEERFKKGDQFASKNYKSFEVIGYLPDYIEKIVVIQYSSGELAAKYESKLEEFIKERKYKVVLGQMTFRSA